MGIVAAEREGFENAAREAGGTVVAAVSEESGIGTVGQDPGVGTAAKDSAIGAAAQEAVRIVAVDCIAAAREAAGTVAAAVGAG